MKRWNVIWDTKNHTKCILPTLRYWKTDFKEYNNEIHYALTLSWWSVELGIYLIIK